MVSANALALVVRKLLDSGFKFTVIGGTVVELELGSRDLGDDVDLFAESPDLLVEEDAYRELAEREGWSVGQTWLGTPRIIARVETEEVPIEFYDNLYDFYVPKSMLDRARRVNIGGVRVKLVHVEDHIVLKANAGRDKDLERLRELANLYRRGKLKLDLDSIREAAKEFEDEAVILRRLRDSGFPL
ncbi:MAG: nucleotidyltransferase [Desulfurococcales archaeon]|nr:nucleotidyltransferase [Desulfurococcales archaeon]